MTELERDQEPVYTMAVAARLTGMHPQTLRKYERAGLLRPARHHTQRLYSAADIRRLTRTSSALDGNSLTVRTAYSRVQRGTARFDRRRPLQAAIPCGPYERRDADTKSIAGLVGCHRPGEPEPWRSEHTEGEFCHGRCPGDPT